MNLLDNIKASQYGELTNSTEGYQKAIDTLTGFKSKITTQKFYQLNGRSISDYIPVLVGENPFTEEIFSFVELDSTGSFEEGIIDTAKGRSRLADVEVGLDKKTVKVVTWARTLGYSIIDVMKAERSAGQSGWNLITSLERARKRNWDLGLQKVAFLGMESDADVDGLLSQSDVTSNTALITKYLKDMTYTEFNAVVKGLISDYVSETNGTQTPDTLVIPQNDLTGLAIPFNPEFPQGDSRIEYMLKSFKMATGNDNFKILPLAYCDEENNNLSLTRYVLFRSNEESGEMQIPVNYTSTVINTENGFTFQSVAYGQFTGFKAYRPQEFRYYDF